MADVNAREQKYLDSNGLVRLVANILLKFEDHTHEIAQVNDLQDELDEINESLIAIQNEKIDEICDEHVS